MNYYNPYFYSMPTTLSTPKVGLFSRLFGGSGITIGKIFNGTQRVLNFANQAIPLVKQVRPMLGNAKTMFKVMNEFKRVEKPKETETSINSNNTIINNSTNVSNLEMNKEENKQSVFSNNNEGPTFFI